MLIKYQDASYHNHFCEALHIETHEIDAKHNIYGMTIKTADVTDLHFTISEYQYNTWLQEALALGYLDLTQFMNVEQFTKRTAKQNPDEKPFPERCNAVILNACHLSEQTLRDYFRTNVTIIPNGLAVTRPKYDLPYDTYLTTDSTTPIIVNLNDRHIDKDSRNNKDPEVPQDLLDLINWMADNYIRLAELKAYDDVEVLTKEEWQKAFATETFLPFYDVEEIKERVGITPPKTETK